MRSIALIAAFAAFSLTCFCQDASPTLTGTVDISVKKGTFICDVTLSNIPRIDDYVIRLNTGMNMRSFSDSAGNLLVPERDKTDTMSYGESIAWYFPTHNGRFLPRSLHLKYVGMYA